ENRCSTCTTPDDGNVFHELRFNRQWKKNRRHPAAPATQINHRKQLLTERFQGCRKPPPDKSDEVKPQKGISYSISMPLFFSIKTVPDLITVFFTKLMATPVMTE